MTGVKSDLTLRLRDQIVSALHRGHLREGDRLSSIRLVATETGEDARAVARAYRELEAEGLVEVRERSGIYVAPQEHIGGVVEEAAQWAARVLLEAWKRGIAVSAIPQFFQRCTATRPVRCAFVEDSEDVITAFCYDLREHIGLETWPVWLDSLPPLEPGAALQQEAIQPALRDADLLVTTAFHARALRPIAKALGKPLIAATVDPDMVAAVERQLRNGALTVVCVDPRFGRRLNIQYGELIAEGGTMRVIDADDAAALAALDRSQPVLLTRAARERLREVDLPTVYPHSPTISATSALEIAQFLVRVNLEAAAAPA